MFSVYKHSGLLRSLPVTCLPHAKFSDIDHAVKYAKEYLDENFTYIAAYDHNLREDVIIQGFSLKSPEGYRTEAYDGLVPYWNGGKKYLVESN